VIVVIGTPMNWGRDFSIKPGFVGCPANGICRTKPAIGEPGAGVYAQRKVVKRPGK